MNTAMIFVVVALVLTVLGLILVSYLALYYRQRSATRTESQCQSGEDVLIASSFLTSSAFYDNFHSQMLFHPSYIYRTYTFLETQPPSPYTLHPQQLYTPPYHCGPEFGPRRVTDGTLQSPVDTGLYEINVRTTSRCAELETWVFVTRSWLYLHPHSDRKANAIKFWQCWVALCPRNIVRISSSLPEKTSRVSEVYADGGQAEEEVQASEAISWKTLRKLLMIFRSSCHQLQLH